MTDQELRVKDVMQTEVVTLQRSDRLDLADDVMRLGRIGFDNVAGYLRDVSVEEVLQRRQRTAIFHAFAQYAAPEYWTRL